MGNSLHERSQEVYNPHYNRKLPNIYIVCCSIFISPLSTFSLVFSLSSLSLFLSHDSILYHNILSTNRNIHEWNLRFRSHNEMSKGTLALVVMHSYNYSGIVSLIHIIRVLSIYKWGYLSMLKWWQTPSEK
jgi:hypothetical protein